MSYAAPPRAPTPDRRSSFAAPAAIAMVTVVVIAAVVAANVLPHKHHHRQPAAAAAPLAPRHVSAIHPTEGPVPPATGAYLGAWVGPTIFTQASSIAAVRGFQQQLGRRLDIVHTYLKWPARFPTPSALAFLRQGSTLLLSWAGASTREIVSGAYDPLIRERAREIKRLGTPIFLEWRWEMDRPNLREQIGSPAEYIAAWKHIRAIFAQEHVHNAAWVWCPTSRGFEDGNAPSYYPGDSQVDWLCADVYPGFGPQRSFADLSRPFLAWASQHPKPVIIGEFGVPVSYGPAERARWLQQAMQTVRSDHQIKAVVYFDADPAGHGPNLSYSLTYDHAALQAFRGLADSRYFSPAGRRARKS